MEKFKERLGKVLVGVIIVLALVCFVLAFKIISGKDASLFGFKIYHIMTGSMEPTVPVGSDILVKAVDPETLEVGDVISFVSRDDAIYGYVNTHRIKQIERQSDGKLYFLTKGDANGTVDSVLVCQDDIKGKMLLHWHLGTLSMFYKFLHTGPGFMTVIALPLLVISWSFISKFRRELAAMEDDDEDGDDEDDDSDEDDEEDDDDSDEEDDEDEESDEDEDEDDDSDEDDEDDDDSESEDDVVKDDNNKESEENDKDSDKDNSKDVLKKFGDKKKNNEQESETENRK